MVAGQWSTAALPSMLPSRMSGSVTFPAPTELMRISSANKTRRIGGVSESSKAVAGTAIGVLETRALRAEVLNTACRLHTVVEAPALEVGKTLAPVAAEHFAAIVINGQRVLRRIGGKQEKGDDDESHTAHGHLFIEWRYFAACP